MRIPSALAVTLDACWQQADSMVEDIFTMVSLHSPPANAKTLLDRWSTDGECEIEFSDGPLLDRGPPYAILEASREPRRILIRRNQRRTRWLDESSPQANLWYAEILGYLSLGFLFLRNYTMNCSIVVHTNSDEIENSPCNSMKDMVILIQAATPR
ncbi:MAG: hypothetical protein FWC27_15885 [Firmicutes bacterium]|nr:hypothetical protein [Bacillota bacterium]